MMYILVKYTPMEEMAGTNIFLSLAKEVFLDFQDSSVRKNRQILFKPLDSILFLHPTIPKIVIHCSVDFVLISLM